MNLPNKLTIGRVILIPVIMIVYAIEPLRTMQAIPGLPHLSVCNLILLILFFLGVLTDWLDGHIARKYNLVTNLGKFLDPLADKLLTMTLFLIILDQSRYYGTLYHIAYVPSLIEWWMVVIILAREFMVTGIRLLAAGKGNVIAAGWYGKVKTTLQFISVLFVLSGCAIIPSSFELFPDAFVIIARILLYSTVAITVYSGADYLIRNLSLLKDDEKKA